MCACLPTFILSLLSGNPRTRQMRENCNSKKPSPLQQNSTCQKDIQYLVAAVLNQMVKNPSSFCIIGDYDHR